MAWVPVRTDLVRCREIIEIARATGRTTHESAGLTVGLWGWASHETHDGLLARLRLADLCVAVGADEAFWNAVVASGWLLETPAGLVIPNFERWNGATAKARLQKTLRQKKWRAGVDAKVDTPVGARVGAAAPTTEQNQTRQKNSDLRSDITRSSTTRAKKSPTPDAERSDQKKQTSGSATCGTVLKLDAGDLRGSVEHLAHRLFATMGYSGEDGAIVWKVAALVHCDRVAPFFRLSQQAAESAAGAVKATGAENKPAYFRTVLVDEGAKVGRDVNKALASIAIPDRFKAAPVFQNGSSRGAPFSS